MNPGYDRNRVIADLKDVILAWCKENNIEPTDSTKVIMNAPSLWNALVASGKMPKQLTYSMMMEGMMGAALSNTFGNLFR